MVVRVGSRAHFAPYSSFTRPPFSPIFQVLFSTPYFSLAIRLSTSPNFVVFDLSPTAYLRECQNAHRVVVRGRSSQTWPHLAFPVALSPLLLSKTLTVFWFAVDRVVRVGIGARFTAWPPPPPGESGSCLRFMPAPPPPPEAPAAPPR